MIAEYSTSDFNFAAYLLTQDFKLLRVEKVNDRKLFVFADPSVQASKLYTDFVNKKLMVELAQFLEAQKKVKAIIWQS